MNFFEILDFLQIRICSICLKISLNKRYTIQFELESPRNGFSPSVIFRKNLMCKIILHPKRNFEYTRKNINMDRVFSLYLRAYTVWFGY